MSYFLDPPALFLLGMLTYYLARRFRWSTRATGILMGVIALGFFMGGSGLLYLDVLGWPLPPTSGSVWMFHTNLTGIMITDVHPVVAVFMLLLYPFWHVAGYLVALRRDIGSFTLRVISYQDVKSRARVKPPSEREITIVRGMSPETMTRKAVAELGGITAYIHPGDKVVIKANICGGNHTIPGSYTSILVVDELVTMIQNAGATPTVIDSDMIWTKFNDIAEAEGWFTWAQQRGVPLVNLADTEMIRCHFGEGSAIHIAPVAKLLVNADVIISVPTMKTHLLTNVTLGMKNMYGTFPEENKAKFHRWGIENVVYEVNKAFTPHLTIIDGTIGGEAFGPLSSNPIEYQTLIASNNVVAADAVACQLMGYAPLRVAHIKRAHEEGLGDASATFDFSTLPPHPKDGHWEKPDPAVSEFYEWLIETFLLGPGMQDLFDVMADFVLYDLATIPIAREWTPAIQRMANFLLADILGLLLQRGYSPRLTALLQLAEKTAPQIDPQHRDPTVLSGDLDQKVQDYIDRVWTEIDAEFPRFQFTRR